MAKIHCLGETVMKLRTQLGMTQDKLAAMSNVNIRTVQRAEKGEYLQIDTVASIAAALKVTLSDLSMPDDAVSTTQAKDEGDDRESNAVVLRPVTSGKAFLDVVYDSFSGKLYCEVEPTLENVDALTAMVEDIEALIPDPWVNRPRMPLSDRLRKSVALTAKLTALQDFDVAVFAGTYTAIAQVPVYDMDEDHWYISDACPHEPVTICRIMLETRKKERVVVKVTDKWDATAPAKTSTSSNDRPPAPAKTNSRDDTDDCPF